MSTRFLQRLAAYSEIDPDDFETMCYEAYTWGAERGLREWYIRDGYEVASSEEAARQHSGEVEIFGIPYGACVIEWEGAVKLIGTVRATSINRIIVKPLAT